jgi:hypothetical protein
MIGRHGLAALGLLPGAAMRTRAGEIDVFWALLLFAAGANVLGLVELIPSKIFPDHYRATHAIFILCIIFGVIAWMYRTRDAFKTFELAPFYSILLFGFFASYSPHFFYTFANLPAVMGDVIWTLLYIFLYLISCGLWVVVVWAIYGAEQRAVFNRDPAARVHPFGFMLLYCALVIAIGIIRFAFFGYGSVSLFSGFATAILMTAPLLILRPVIADLNASPAIIAASFSLLAPFLASRLHAQIDAAIMSDRDWMVILKRSPDEYHVLYGLYRLGTQLAGALGAYLALRLIAIRPLADMVRRKAAPHS